MNRIFEKQNKQTIISLVTSIVSMILSALVSFMLSPFIIRTLGVEANGFTQLAVNFVNYASLLTIALNSMAARFITVSFYNSDEKSYNKYYSSIFIGNIFIIALLSVPAIFLIVKLNSILNIETADINQIKLLFGFAFINYFVSMITSVFTISTYVMNAQYIQNTVSMVRSILYAIIVFLVFTVFLPKAYYISLINLALSILILPFFIATKKRLIPEIKYNIHSFDIKAIWTLISSGIWNTINQCGALLMTGLDLLISNIFLGPVQMGILAVAKTIPNYIILLAATVNTSFSPSLTIEYSKGNKGDVLKSLTFLMKLSSMMISIPVMIMCIYGKFFYKLWIPTMNAEQLTILSILTCVGYIPFAGPQTLYNVFTTTNKLVVNSTAVLLGGLLNVLIVVILLRNTSLGLFLVAGVSSVISIIRNLVITVPYTARILGLKWYTFYKDVGISMLCCLVCGLACLLLQAIIPPTTWASLCISVAASYLLGLFLCNIILLRKNERKAVFNLIRKRVLIHK